jgi:hypothetical protein
MKRRNFITLLGGAAATWPLTARAQQPERVRRIGVLVAYAESDPEAQARIAAFRQGLRELGWTEGHNLRMELGWGTGDPDRVQTLVTELISLAPDVIVAHGTPALTALYRARARSQSYSSRSSTQSVPVTCRVWPYLEATLPGSAHSNLKLAANGWSCSKRSRPV